MPKNPTGPFWFIREGDKTIQCSKAAFDKAISEGKSIRYNGYPDKRTEKNRGSSGSFKDAAPIKPQPANEAEENND